MNLESLHTAIRQARSDCKHGSKISNKKVAAHIADALSFVNVITLAKEEREFDHESQGTQTQDVV
jgi:hypothetical protein